MMSTRARILVTGVNGDRPGICDKKRKEPNEELEGARRGHVGCGCQEKRAVGWNSMINVLPPNLPIQKPHCLLQGGTHMERTNIRPTAKRK